MAVRVFASMICALLALPLCADDLPSFVNAQLREHGVPGAAVVVIRGNRVVSAHGVGVTNAVTRRSVTAETVFPVASNGKAVAGYLAVRLLDLDTPVLAQAAVDLPDTPLHRRITPRDLLTHTSGLGNFLRDRRRAVSFPPGERFAYSGVGFMVLQELLERRSGKTVDALLREQLRMPRAWFGERPAGVTAVAAPHIEVSRALAPFTIVFAPLMLVACGALALLRRLTWRSAGVAFAIAAAATFAFLLNRSGSWVLSLWFTAGPLIVLGLAALALRYFRIALVVLIAVLVLARNLPVPLPTIETGPANVASSLRATAPELAQFLIEASRVPEMTAVAHEIDARSAWALGIAIERHERGRDLWHWGSSPGAKSIMILCPETGDGVVVLTNGSEGSEPMRNIAAKVMGREGCWRPGCATRGQ